MISFAPHGARYFFEHYRANSTKRSRNILDRNPTWSVRPYITSADILRAGEARPRFGNVVNTEPRARKPMFAPMARNQ
jgi:hypothetical protein